MKSTLFAIATVLPLLAGVIPTAHAVECAAGVVRAGCAGPNGAVVAGPRGAAAAGTNGIHMRSAPRAGTTATGARGNTATKAVAPGCAFVNGQRVPLNPVKMLRRGAARFPRGLIHASGGSRME